MNKLKEKFKKPLKLRTSIRVDGKRFPDLWFAFKEILEQQRKEKKIKSRRNRKAGGREMQTRNRDHLYFNAFECLLANMVVAHLQERAISISRTPSHYRYKASNQKRITGTALKFVTDLCSVDSARLKKKKNSKSLKRTNSKD